MSKQSKPVALPNFIVPNEKWCSDCGKLTVFCCCTEMDVDSTETVDSMQEYPMEKMD